MSFSICFFLMFYLDCPVKYQTSFSESASPTMEGIVNFHNHIMVVLCFIAVFVGWLMVNSIKYYSEFKVSTHTQFTHSKELEIVWTYCSCFNTFIFSNTFIHFIIFNG